jgi:putative intracellular protease/amidase
MAKSKGKIGVLIEEHFDKSEYRIFNEFFPKHGYEVEYLAHLWSQPSLRFGSNPDDDKIDEHVVVSREINTADPKEYKAILLIGAYAMDRMRYQPTMKKGQKNTAPAVEFLRMAMKANVKVGTICHSLWLFCADRELIRGRKVTCAHNIVCDVENAGGEVVYDEDGTADIVIDGNLISAKHPEVNDLFVNTVLKEIEK